MPKYIDADKFSKAVQCISGVRLDCLDYSARSILTLLSMVEAADVEKVEHGHWNDDRSCHHISKFQCSCCGFDSDTTFDFCPGCGAKMDLN